MSKQQETYVPIVIEDYYPKVTSRLLNKILKIAPKQTILFGFSENMKLTAYVDKFIKVIGAEAFIFRTVVNGIFIMKNRV
tara:strand:- start:701 stop:940 length:240 start_codon:yes stop_codon:yes gene_type:complete